MVIRPMAGRNMLGELGRSAGAMGAKGGPAAFLRGMDEVVLGNQARSGAKLYTAAPLFKIMGSVELMSEEYDPAGENVLGSAGKSAAI